jgi:hypothetical protein
MATSSRLRTIGRAGGVAATTAPYVRRLATDDELRDDVSDFIRSANNVMNHIRSDARLRRDVRSMVESAQSGADPLRGDIGPRHPYLRNLVIGAGLVITSIGVAIAVAWPRTRSQLTRVADQTTQRAGATVQDVRERMSHSSDESDVRAA